MGRFASKILVLSLHKNGAAKIVPWNNQNKLDCSPYSTLILNQTGEDKCIQWLETFSGVNHFNILVLSMLNFDFD